ncbi:AzlC family ABC transporter permease [Clostridium sp. AN503]|uniref:AzlC family ABC transporter permease n=1 Tax=Clostridium sp. AN503 TaxID=3160598 RepID=UPI00345769F9
MEAGTVKGGEGRRWFLKGMRDGTPIGLGYFAVAFTLGIASKKAGLTAFQASVMSATMLASAGQFAGIGMIAAGAGYMELAVTELVVNLRYLLMSSALSQKVQRDKPFYHRFLMAYEVTDEIFGIAMSVEGRLHPAYMYGAVTVAAPGWVLGTFLGSVIGMILPANVMSAMNVALYGMFLAVVIPPSKKSRVIAGVVALSMAASSAFSLIPALSNISSGFQMIILTILLAGTAAVLFPVKPEGEEI